MPSTGTYIYKPSLEKKIPIIDKDKHRVVSFSQYTKYFKCPKSWELRYIKKHKESKESIDLVFGQAMHSVIQEWLKVIYTETVKKANLMDLSKMLLQTMTSEYGERKAKQGEHFSTPEELSSYFNDGVEILNYLVKKRTRYFTTKKMTLIAIEFPVAASIHENYPTIKLNGFIDLIFLDENSGKYYIIDLKTSTRGWNDYKKKDELTTDQVLIYKKYLADLLQVDISLIVVSYFILKRKLQADSLWPQKRIQEFSPSSGKVSLNRVNKNLRKFVEDCFNTDGSYNTEKNYPAMAGKNYYNCVFCPYDEREDLCPKNNRICLTLE